MPPAADLKPEAEPAYPLEALGDSPAAKAAEDAWWNKVLIWGRTEHGKVERICVWAKVLGDEFEQKLPDGWCDKP